MYHIAMLKYIKLDFPQLDVIAGNIVTREQTAELTVVVPVARELAWTVAARTLPPGSHGHGSSPGGIRANRVLLRFTFRCALHCKWWNPKRLSPSASQL